MLRLPRARSASDLIPDRRRRSTMILAALMIPPSVLGEPTRGRRLHRCCLHHAFCRACPEHHRRRLARAARSIGARDERERPARGLWGFSWPWPTFSLELLVPGILRQRQTD